MTQTVKFFTQRCWLFLAMGVFAGCTVTPASAPSGRDAMRDDLLRVQQSQQGLARQIEQLQNNMMLLEARFRDQQQIIEQLRRGEMAKKVTSPGERAEPGVEPTMPASGTVPAATTLNPTETYLQAFSDYAAGRYSQCIEGFQTFLQYFPANEYAGNAQYWLGECYYSQQRYSLAAIEFNKVVEEYPRGGKTPEALLKMALALEQMGQEDRAREALAILQERYKDSPAAKKARERTR